MQLLLLLVVLNNSAARGGDTYKCTNCVQNNKNDNNKCVSGEMRVEEQFKGLISVSQLSEGDVIRGITGADRTPAWCKVVAVFPVPHSQNQTTYDGFTEGHMVVDRDTVHSYGTKGEVREGPVFTLDTECDAAVNSAGQAFTPISTSFCPHELSWDEYLPLIAAIRRTTDRTGQFWFDLNAYHDNETAMVPHWVDQLPAICRELLRCAREDRCQEFETIMEEFVREHLNKEYAEVVERVFPNMGGDVEKSQAGTITEVVRLRGRNYLVILSAVGSAMLLAGLILVIAILMYRRRMTKKKAEKKLLEINHPSVNAGDVNA